MIDAYQFYNRVGPDDRPPWIVDALAAGKVKFTQPRNAHAFLDIETLEGTMRANTGDWIVRGTAGELYPVKPDIFAQTYEPA